MCILNLNRVLRNDKNYPALFQSHRAVRSGGYFLLFCVLEKEQCVVLKS